MLDITQNHYAENYAIAGVGNTVKRIWPTQRKRVSNFFKDDVDFSVHFHKKSVKKYHVFDWMCVRTLARNCKISSYIIYIAAALELQYTIIMNFKSSRIPYVNWISNADVLKRLYSHEKGLKGTPYLKNTSSSIYTYFVSNRTSCLYVGGML